MGEKKYLQMGKSKKEKSDMEKRLWRRRINNGIDMPENAKKRKRSKHAEKNL